MTLHRRLVLSISFLLFALLAANLVVNVHNARVNFYEQLQVHAQDTATSLGFTISQAALAKDTVQVSSMIDVIFDRGYYRRIIYRDLEGNDVVSREASIETPDVPLWFVQQVQLPSASGVADIASGWFQLGKLVVESHPGFAYQNLWRAFKEQIWLFLMTSVLCYGLLGIGLKYLLRPLQKVEEQANAICNRQFVIVDQLPSIPELKKTVTAMNKMVAKVKDMFSQQLAINDRLLVQTRTDELTGLPNKRDFEDRLAAHLQSDRTAGSGLMMLIHMDNLLQVNEEQGREVGNHCLRQVARIVQQQLGAFGHSSCLVSRNRATDFAAFVPTLTEEESHSVPHELSVALKEVEWQSEALHITIGAVFCPELKVLVEEGDSQNAGRRLMVAADAALAAATETTDQGYCWQPYADSAMKQPLATVQNWQQWLDELFEQSSLDFYFQPVWYLEHGEQQLLFNEVLTHARWQENDYTPGFFLPMATRLGKIEAFDQLVVDKLWQDFANFPEPLCINLSVDSIRNERFVSGLVSRLKQNRELAKLLDFELPASGLVFAEQAMRRFAKQVHDCGARFSLHHFGRDTANFSFLHSLPINYLKIDRSLTHNIEKDEDCQFFVRSLVAIAKSCDVLILAEGVETDMQWQILKALGIQGGQGYFLGRPGKETVIA